MAGPLTGIGGQAQQIPLANSFQPGQSNNTQVRPEQQQKQAETNIVQPKRSQPASSQSGESSKDVLKAQTQEFASSSASRGSIIDITV